MSKDLKKYQKVFYIGIILIALGITLDITVLIAIGGLFFIIAMVRKKEEIEQEKN